MTATAGTATATAGTATAGNGAGLAPASPGPTAPRGESATPPHRSQGFQDRRRLRLTAVCVLAALVVVSICLAIVVGQYAIGVSDLPRLLVAGPDGDDRSSQVLWNIRLPRVVLGLLVGAALGVAGTVMQAVFANPLAEPGVIGVSSGAGLGAALAMVFGWSMVTPWAVPAVAFVAALGTTLLVYRMSSSDGRARVLVLVLTGIAVNAIAGAGLAYLVFLAPTTTREEIVFWQMGSLNGAQWKHVAIVLPLVALGVVAALMVRRKLDTLALGDRAAAHVGTNVEQLRLFSITITAVLTAAAVAFGGIIGFVGLIVPHLLRTVFGPANTWLLPLSAVGGAILVLLSDSAARTVIAYADLPIGIFTALVGAPTFFFLMRRSIKKGLL